MSKQPASCTVIHNGDCPVCDAGIEALKSDGATYTDIAKSPEQLR